KMVRIPEVLDCWFESGAMPYASRGVHFQNENFEKPVQADFIAEGLDQTRGWFYTLHVLGCALIGENIYKNVITNGIVLAEDGQKMSKSKQNYPDPNIIFDKYGADAMRFYMLSSPVVRAENFRFMENGVQEVVKTILLPLQNVYAFFSTYANIDEWQATNTLQPKTDLDKWILSEYEELRSEFTEKFEAYKLDDALRGFPDFVDSLTNWHVRRSRDRFWTSEISAEKISGYETLHFILKNVAKMLAPISPFFAENLWKNLTGNEVENSVHLQNLAESAQQFLNPELSERTKLLRDTIKLASAIRTRKKIKLRQPLAKLSFALSGKIEFTESDLEILKEECNVKNVVILDNLDGLAKQIVKANARVVGKRFGKKTQEVIKAGKAGEFEILENGDISLVGEILSGNPDLNEFEFGFECAEGIEGDGNSNAVVLLDTEISGDLALEGLSRELIRAIQEGRKSSGFEISNRIEIEFATTSAKIIESYEKFGKIIDHDTLTVARKKVEEISGKNIVKVEIDGEEIVFGLKVSG
ncbi:TPA: class I tRNA ligase family protein, partial [Candidatus Gracilibacteria bacterium]|nr:class I tRNA ligase family protein [Candidatus Gracilibacteria bacterium]